MPSYWGKNELRSYQSMINMIDNCSVELIRDHVAIAYCYGCEHAEDQKERNPGKRTHDVCFVNISHNYAFAMVCTYVNVLHIAPCSFRRRSASSRMSPSVAKSAEEW